MITDLRTKRHSEKRFSEFLPTRWRQKSTGIDMAQTYVTVTLCCVSKKVNMLVSSESYSDFTFLVQVYPGCPEKRPLNGAVVLFRQC